MIIMGCEEVGREIIYIGPWDPRIPCIHDSKNVRSYKTIRDKRGETMVRFRYDDGTSSTEPYDKVAFLGDP